jgi:hypothetical protein
MKHRRLHKSKILRRLLNTTTKNGNDRLLYRAANTTLVSDSEKRSSHSLFKD